VRRPLLKARMKTVFIALAAAAAAAAAWFGWFQFGPGSTSGSEPRMQYSGISIEQPSEESGLLAVADYAPPESSQKPGGGPIILVSDVEDDTGYLVIDAVTGEVIVDEIGPRRRKAADDLIASVRLETTGEAVWPLADVAPPSNRMTHGNISYVEPDPSSGIFVLRQEGDGIGVSGVALFIHNGRSRMLVDGATRTIDDSRVLEADREAFERFAETVEVAESVP
jgi:hypothetical protein